MIQGFFRLGQCNASARWIGSTPSITFLRTYPAFSRRAPIVCSRNSVSRFSARRYLATQNGPSGNALRPSNATVARILLWGAVVAFFGLNICSLHEITGHSMSPTINPASQSFHDVVILNRYAASTRHYFWNVRTPKKQDLKIGDVIVMYSPLDPRLKITKRILALPGDIVFKKRPDELDPTLRESKDEDMLRVRIPPGHMWVEGDASANEYHNSNVKGNILNVPSNIKSRDSRQFGPVPMALVIGRVDYIFFPFSRFGQVSGRPKFDAKKANEKRHARERNMMIPRDLQLRRAHPDDSAISPYSDWEWITGQGDSERAKGGSRGRKLNEKEAKQRRGRSHRDDDVETIWKDQLNRMSRGGQLGHYVDAEDI